VEEAFTVLGRMLGIEGLFSDVFAVLAVVDAVEALSGLFSFLQSDRQETVDQEVGVSSDGRGKVGIDGEVEAEVTQVFFIVVANCLIRCLSQLSQDLAVDHHQLIF